MAVRRSDSASTVSRSSGRPPPARIRRGPAKVRRDPRAARSAGRCRRSALRAAPAAAGLRARRRGSPPAQQDGDQPALAASFELLREPRHQRREPRRQIVPGQLLDQLERAQQRARHLPGEPQAVSREAACSAKRATAWPIAAVSPPAARWATAASWPAPAGTFHGGEPGGEGRRGRPAGPSPATRHRACGSAQRREMGMRMGMSGTLMSGPL